MPLVGDSLCSKEQPSVKFVRMSCDESKVKQFLQQSRKISDDKVASLLSDRNCSQQASQVLGEWAKRAEALANCAKLAKAPVYDEDAQIAALWRKARNRVEFAPTKSNPRIDSYAARDESKTDQDFNDWVRREMMSEEVVRNTTDGFFKQRCGFSLQSPHG